MIGVHTLTLSYIVWLIESLEEAKKCICHAECFISVKSYWLFQHWKHITLNSGLYDAFLIASILEIIRRDTTTNRFRQ